MSRRIILTFYIYNVSALYYNFFDMAKEIMYSIEQGAEKEFNVPMDLVRNIKVEVSEKVNALNLCDCTGECSCADTCGAR